MNMLHFFLPGMKGSRKKENDKELSRRHRIKLYAAQIGLDIHSVEMRMVVH